MRKHCSTQIKGTVCDISGIKPVKIPQILISKDKTSFKYKLAGYQNPCEEHATCQDDGVTICKYECIFCQSHLLVVGTKLDLQNILS